LLLQIRKIDFKNYSFFSSIIGFSKRTLIKVLTFSKKKVINMGVNSYTFAKNTIIFSYKAIIYVHKAIFLLIKTLVFSPFRIFKNL
jgi:hypothetical protein